MKTSERFAAAAEALQFVPGTSQRVKFSEGGRDPAVGLDCAGLIIAALRQCGFDPADARYAIRSGDLMTTVDGCLETMFERIAVGQIPEELAPGDVLALRFAVRGMYNHLGIYVGRRCMVHAYDHRPIWGVTLTPIDHGLARRVHQVWRMKPEFEHFVPFA